MHFSSIIPETRPSVTDTDFFIHDLTELSCDPSYFEFKDRLDKIIQSVRQTSDIIGPKSANYFEVPKKYLESFLSQHTRDSYSYTEVTPILFKDVLSTTEHYIDLIKKMVTELPTDHAANFRNPLLSQVKCTVQKYSRDNIVQKAYYCDTCGLQGNNMLCEGCVKTCHSGHKVTYRGVITGFCDCRFETDLCQLLDTCSLKHSGKTYVKQPRYACHTCKMNIAKGKFICKFCSEKCHEGHQIEYLGFVEGYCDCDEMYSFCLLHKNP